MSDSMITIISQKLVFVGIHVIKHIFYRVKCGAREIFKSHIPRLTCNNKLLWRGELSNDVECKSLRTRLTTLQQRNNTMHDTKIPIIPGSSVPVRLITFFLFFFFGLFDYALHVTQLDLTVFFALKYFPILGTDAA